MAFIREYGGPSISDVRGDPNGGFFWDDDLAPIDPELDADLLEFAEQIEVPVVIDETIQAINAYYAEIGRERFTKQELAKPYRHPETGLPIFEYGPADGKTAVVVPFQFIGGTDESLNMRLYLLKEVLDAMNIVDEDGQEIRVIGIASPSIAVRMGIKLGDYMHMLQTAEHGNYTAHIAKTLECLNIERVITAGASLGGMVSAQLIEHIVRSGTQEAKGTAVANPPGQGRSRGSIPWSMYKSLRRYNKSGGNTRELVEASQLQPLIDILPKGLEYHGRKLARLDRALDVGSMICRTVGHAGNLGLWRVLSERTTPPAMQEGLANGVPTDYMFSGGDRVPYLRRGLDEVIRLQQQYPDLMNISYEPNRAHEIVSDPRTMTAFYIQLVQRALESVEQQTDHETDSLVVQ